MKLLRDESDEVIRIYTNPLSADTEVEAMVHRLTGEISRIRGYMPTILELFKKVDGYKETYSGDLREFSRYENAIRRILTNGVDIGTNSPATKIEIILGGIKPQADDILINTFGTMDRKYRIKKNYLISLVYTEKSGKHIKDFANELHRLRSTSDDRNRWCTAIKDYVKNIK